MTPTQFAALAELLRLRAGPATQAVRLVMVAGLTVPDAARAVGMPYQLALKAAKRAQRGLALAQAAAGSISPPVGEDAENPCGIFAENAI